MSLLDVSDAFDDLLEPIDIEVSVAGTRTKGRWETGGFTIAVAEAVVQPASNRDINELRIQGDSTGSYKKFYSEYPFKSADKSSGTEADIVVYAGERFKVLTVANWGALGNYKKIMTVRI